MEGAQESQGLLLSEEKECLKESSNELHDWLKSHKIEEVGRMIKPLEKEDLIRMTEDELEELCKLLDVDSSVKIAFKNAVLGAKLQGKENELKNNSVECYNNDCTVIQLLGDSGVGKTTIFNGYSSNAIFKCQQYLQKMVHLNDDKQRVVTVLDKLDVVYGALTADCFIVVYDIFDRRTFDGIEERCYKIIHNQRQFALTENPFVMLIGNKRKPFSIECDNYENGKQNKDYVTSDEALGLANKYKWRFAEVDAKSTYEINTLFNSCIQYSIAEKAEHDAVKESGYNSNFLSYSHINDIKCRFM